MCQCIPRNVDRIDHSNYRPISLTCVACNIKESIIKDSVITYLLENNLLSNCQFGFVSCRSVQLQHLSLLIHWTDILDSGHTIDVIFLYFKKAFDSVPHIRLLSKLHSYGLRDPPIGWLKSFLIGRRQRVCVHETVFSWHNVKSVIPQGSVHGPVLFLLYVNDLPDAVASDVYMSADDTKIYRPMTSHEDTTILQNDLDCLQSWSAKWLLNLNLHKCKVMSITKSTACNHDTADYYLKNQSSMSSSTSILRCTEEIDLGVVLDIKLSFRNHISMSINKANRLLGIIRRSFCALDNTSFALLHKAIVRQNPLICCHYLESIQKGYIDDLEKIQHRAIILLQTI